jgi:small subunit ribosomal protein S20
VHAAAARGGKWPGAADCAIFRLVKPRYFAHLEKLLCGAFSADQPRGAGSRAVTRAQGSKSSFDRARVDSANARWYKTRIPILEDFLIKHPSAVKRHRQSLKKRTRNVETKSKLRTLIKRARQAIETNSRESATSHLRAVDKALGKAVSKGIIKGNTASRWMSRLARSAAHMPAAR